MTVLLFMAITTYGAMVLTGVVEEKSSRVVEVLLARMPARNLLAGKIAGIGLLGLAQIAVTAVVALVAVAIDRLRRHTRGPRQRPRLGVVWFVLGYALYATVFGALGSLASRAEDARASPDRSRHARRSAYFVSFAAIGSADTTWARLRLLVPAHRTARHAQPHRHGRRHMVGTRRRRRPHARRHRRPRRLGGRVYTGAILHTGPTLKLRDAWQE